MGRSSSQNLTEAGLEFHADGEDHRGEAVPLQPALNGKRRFVMEKFLEKSHALKDKLPREVR